MAGSFTGNPTRTVTLFDTEGNPLGPPEIQQNVYAFVSKGKLTVLPPGHDLESTPYDVTWNAELDRELTPRVTLRLSTLFSRTYDLFLVRRHQLPGTEPLLLMTNSAGERYHDFESTVRIHASKLADINFSFVHSHARGDLNVFSQVYVPFEQPVIRPNFIADLNSNVPNRFVTWGEFGFPGRHAVRCLTCIPGFLTRRSMSSKTTWASPTACASPIRIPGSKTFQGFSHSLPAVGAESHHPGSGGRLQRHQPSEPPQRLQQHYLPQLWPLRRPSAPYV